MADIPHFALPFRFSGGRAIEVEQDSIEDVASCVYAILVTEPGTRYDLPDFGSPDQSFSTGVDTDRILRDVSRWEPRAIAAVEAGWDFDAFINTVRVNVSVREEEDRG